MDTLDEELLDYVDETIRMVHHPLIIRDLAHGASRINAEFFEKQAKAEQALRDDDWELYIVLHERPYRLHALMQCVEFDLTGDEYWRLVGYVWTDSENIYHHRDDWKDLWSRDIPNRQLAMTEEERSCLAAMPEEFRVWRGTGHRESLNGLSWTFDPDRAKWFAKRFTKKGNKALVATGMVKRANVFALFLGRKESEIVSTLVTLDDVMELQVP
jgi:hypothetical protein